MATSVILTKFDVGTESAELWRVHFHTNKTYFFDQKAL